MKRILILLLVCCSVLVFGQTSPKFNFVIENASTAFGINLPKGCIIYDMGADKLYILTAVAASTATLTTATKVQYPSMTGSPSQNKLALWDSDKTLKTSSICTDDGTGLTVAGPIYSNFTGDYGRIYLNDATTYIEGNSAGSTSYLTMFVGSSYGLTYSYNAGSPLFAPDLLSVDLGTPTVPFGKYYGATIADNGSSVTMDGTLYLDAGTTGNLSFDNGNVRIVGSNGVYDNMKFYLGNSEILSLAEGAVTHSLVPAVTVNFGSAGNTWGNAYMSNVDLTGNLTFDGAGSTIDAWTTTITSDDDTDVPTEGAVYDAIQQTTLGFVNETGTNVNDQVAYFTDDNTITSSSTLVRSANSLQLTGTDTDTEAIVIYANTVGDTEFSYFSAMNEDGDYLNMGIYGQSAPTYGNYAVFEQNGLSGLKIVMTTDITGSLNLSGNLTFDGAGSTIDAWTETITADDDTDVPTEGAVYNRTTITDNQIVVGTGTGIEGTTNFTYADNSQLVVKNSSYDLYWNTSGLYGTSGGGSPPLGTSSARWQKLWTGGADFSGSLQFNQAGSLIDAFTETITADDDTDLPTEGAVYNYAFPKASTGTWKVLYSNGTNVWTELALGAANTYLMSNGASSAPTFETVASGWIGTATSDLNMSDYDIDNVDTLEVEDKLISAKRVYSIVSSDNDWTGDAMYYPFNQTEDGSITMGQTLFLQSDGDVYLSDADAASTMKVVGIALETKTSGSGTILVLKKGTMRYTGWSITGITTGYTLFASTTQGAMEVTAPNGDADQVQVLGRVLDATNEIIEVDISPDVIEVDVP